MTCPPSPSARSLKHSRPKSRLIFKQCRTSGGGTKQLKSNTTLTLTTPRNFSAHWKPFLAPLPLVAPHYCRQTGRRSSRTWRVSASAGRSTSALSWLGPHQLTQTPWIRSPTACTGFAHKTPYHRGDQEGDLLDNLRQSIGKGWHPCWDLQGSRPRCPWGLPQCPVHCLGGGDDARQLPRRPGHLPL